jgi:hypothetical protein
MANENDQTGTEGTSTSNETNGQASLQEAVDLASDLLVMARDQKNTGITLLMTPESERAAIVSFIQRGKQQVAASKQIGALALEKAKQRNAGRKLPPSKQPKAKTTPAAGK